MQIIDNVVNEQYQDLIIREITNASWRYNYDLAFKAVNGGLNQMYDGRNTPGISNTIYDKVMKDSPSSQKPYLYWLLMPLILETACKTNLEIKEITRMATFMHFPIEKTFRKKYDNIHVDSKIPHKVFLYYVNDSDGDTYLFDKTIKDMSPEEKVAEAAKGIKSRLEFNVVKKVSPKKGRMLIFDGDIYHCGSGPTKNNRCIINTNVIV